MYQVEEHRVRAVGWGTLTFDSVLNLAVCARVYVSTQTQTGCAVSKIFCVFISALTLVF